MQEIDPDHTMLLSESRAGALHFLSTQRRLRLGAPFPEFKFDRQIVLLIIWHNKYCPSTMLLVSYTGRNRRPKHHTRK
jgi:hypothetical protein